MTTKTRVYAFLLFLAQKHVVARSMVVSSGIRRKLVVYVSVN